MRNLAALTRSLGVFRRSPIYALALTGSLAIGIATACGAFAVVKRALFDHLAYPASHRIVTIRTVMDGEARLGSSYLFGQDLRTSPLLVALSADWGTTVTYEAHGASERLTGALITPEYFDVVGVAPFLGSRIRPGDDDVVVVSASFFARALGGDAQAIGREIVIDGVPTRVVGVMPAGFAAPYLTEADLWLPLDTTQLAQERMRGQRGVVLQARLADNVTLEQVRAYLEVFGDEQRSRHGEAFSGQSWVVDRLRDVQVEASRPLLVALAAVSGLLVLIVLTNVAGLAATRAMQLRQRHAVQLALGASETRLFLQRFAEALALCLTATAAGLWAGRLLVGWAATRQEYLLEDVPTVAFDPSVAAFGIGVGLAATVVAALVPHRALRRVSADELLGSGRAFSSGRLARTRVMLSVAQIAIAIVLVIAASLLVRTASAIASIPMGYDASSLVSVGVTLPASRYTGAASQQELERAVLERMRGIEGVTGAAASADLPGGGTPMMSVALPARPDLGAHSAAFLSVNPDFLSLLGIQVRNGRGIDAGDRAEGAAVVVINERMARTFWPGGDSLGARVRLSVGLPREREAVVVGIVSDVRQHGPAEEIVPTVYLPTSQNPVRRRMFVVRTAKPVGALAGDLRAAVHAADPLLAVTRPRTEVDRLDDWASRHRRFLMSVLVSFGGFASLLCALGLYAVISLNASSRRREFALRMALGARHRQVAWLVLRQAVWLGGIGAAVGVAASFMVTSTLQALLHGVGRADPFVLVSAILASLLLAAAASLLPAMRAARVDPVSILKAG